MFKYHDSIVGVSGDDLVEIFIDDRPVKACKGDNLATVLLVNGLLPVRTNPVSGAPRSPYCMMGTCFECLVELDGESNHQACMTTVRHGMRLKRRLSLS